MRVLGTDPGLAMGYGVLEKNTTNIVHLESGVCDWLKTPRKKKRYALREQGKILQRVIEQWQVDVIVIENMLGQRGGSAKQSLGYYLCLLMLFAGECPIYGVHSSHWRKIVFDNGNATKEMAIHYVRERYGVSGDENQCEALCIGESFLRSGADKYYIRY